MRVVTVVRRIIGILVTTALVGGLAACATGDAAGSGEKPTTLTLATGFAIDDVDPLENGFWGNEFGWSELLMRPVLGADPKPWILKSLDNVDDLTWKLTLNKGVHFQNGDPLDAKALADVMQYSLSEVAGLKSIAGTTVKPTGDLEVTLTTPQPTPNLPFLLADESKFVIFDLPAYLKAKGDPQKLIDAKLYTGPYVVQKLDTQTMTMKADPDYWGGTPALKSVTVKFIEEAQSRILAVQKGEVDLALYPPTDAAKNLNGRKDSYWVTGTPKGPTFQFQLNQKTGPLTDVKVRKAVLSAINYKEIANDVMNGLYEVSNGMYSPKAAYYEPMFKTDTKATDKLLTGAGYAKGSDGMYAKDGNPLTLTVLTYPQQPDSGTLGVAVQSELKTAGIGVEIQQVPDTDEAMQDPSVKWNAAIVGNGTTSFPGDPISSLQNYFVTDGPSNYSGISDPNLDALVSKLATTMDTTERDDLLKQIQAAVGDGAYMGFLGMRVPGVVAGPKWKNYKVPTANLWVDASTTAGS
ncbi:peptide/nickel transport system substrate-binding protein [Antricoccus suffuscus]|uniref:Peptide/nickel transport system substrate-binding protein n=1 Tax=Antricoccus suffuscus TaxID=1629062 RepID=A0A2T0ZVW4_9ACTN|nr:ABC transporter substrate-binding protein [Antricoccus suffuscus]PRZ40490.1 peptide/nickel transport system substrate-binding protein [Antricoccus suffuscus]